MELTNELLENKYDEFNDLYFGSELPEDLPVFPISEMYSYGRYDEMPNEENPEITYPFIAINDKFDYSEDELNIILLHEMIHCYLVMRKIELDEPHGKAFVEMAHKIEEMSGYEDIVHGVKFLKHKDKTYYILVLDLEGNDKQKFIGVFLEREIFYYYVEFFINYKDECSMNVDSFKIYTSTSNIFDSFDVNHKIVNLETSPIDNEKFYQDILPNLNCNNVLL